MSNVEKIYIAGYLKELLKAPRLEDPVKITQHKFCFLVILSNSSQAHFEKKR